MPVATRLLALAIVALSSTSLFSQQRTPPASAEKVGDGVATAIRNLKSLKREVRLTAAKALGGMKDVRGVEPLIGALTGDSDDDVRREAGMALGKIKDARAIGPLIGMLGYQSTDVRFGVRMGLSGIGGPAVEALISALGDARLTAEAREEAVRTLGAIKDRRAVDPLMVLLKSSRLLTAHAATLALGEIGDPRAVEPLLAILNLPKGGQSSLARQSAAQALGQIADDRAIETAIAALNDSDAYLRKYAARGLARSKDPRVPTALLAALRTLSSRGPCRTVDENPGVAGENMILCMNSEEYPHLGVIAGAYEFFVRRGERGSEEFLSMALFQFGDLEMANALLRSGNVELQRAAGSWATRPGYRLVPGPGSGLRWGQR
jgi:HEAT repeat protein